MFDHNLQAMEGKQIKIYIS